jgi:hypothetical protein
MTRPRSVYTYLDKSYQLSLKTYADCLRARTFFCALTTWNDGSKVLVTINHDTATSAMTVEYIYGGRHYKCEIVIVSEISNLGRGLVWFFICAMSGKRCRKLYFVEGLFVHRDAFPGQYYYHQTDSKKWRKSNCLIPRLNTAMAKLRPDTLRPFYDDKPTKRFLRFCAVSDKYIKKIQNLH